MAGQEQSSHEFVVKACWKCRDDLKKTEDYCRLLHSILHDTTRERSDLHDVTPERPETEVQMELAYRHIEDARMRLGKVLQYGENEDQSWESL